MKLLIGFVFLSGSECISPTIEAPRETRAHRVDCAIPVYGISGNPFKVVQEPNTISKASPKKPSKKKKPSRKKRK